MQQNKSRKLAGLYRKADIGKHLFFRKLDDLNFKKSKIDCELNQNDSRPFRNLKEVSGVQYTEKFFIDSQIYEFWMLHSVYRKFSGMEKEASFTNIKISKRRLISADLKIRVHSSSGLGVGLKRRNSMLKMTKLFI